MECISFFASIVILTVQVTSVSENMIGRKHKNQRTFQ